MIDEARKRSEQKCYDHSRPSLTQEFFDLSNVGLRRSVRLINIKDEQSTSTISNGLYGLTIMVDQVHSEIKEYSKVTYHIYQEGYDIYLDMIFDDTHNSMSIIGQVYLSIKINSEIYTLK